MPSIQPLSSSPISALIWEIDDNASTIFGDSPFNFSSTPVTPVTPIFGKRLASVMQFMRDTIWPSIFASINTTKMTIVRRSRTVDPSDPLYFTWSDASEDVYGVVMGPSVENIQAGLLTASDFECLFAAKDLAIALTERDAVYVGSTKFDIVGIRPLPNVPDPIGYRLMLRRAV